jgi:perosamine synthetase
MGGGMIPLAKPDLSGNERKYVLQALDSGWLTHHGEFEARFERMFSDYIGKSSIATSSGTGALHIALLALGIGRGDEVIVPSLTFGATASVVRNVGAFPVLVDVDENGLLDWEDFRRKKTFRTKAVIPVHLYGERCPIPDLNIPVIEDCCEATWIRPRAIGCYSFYGNKPITTGEGGMLVGLDARAHRDGGFDCDYDMACAGLNYRMTNLQAALGCAQMEHIDELLAKRFRNAAIYASNFEGFGKWLFVIKAKAGLRQFLEKRGVETRPVFKPMHLTAAFGQSGDFPNSERIWKEGLCLPTGPHVDANYVTGLIHEHQQLRRASSRSRQLHAQV